MSPGVYGAVFRARVMRLLQYRAAAWAGVATQVAFGCIHAAVFAAFYRGVTQAHPLGLADLIAYVWLGQAFFALLPWRLDPDFHRLFREGGVAYEFLRPVELYSLWWARQLAFMVAPTLLRCGPVLAFASLTGQLGPPPDAAAAAAFAAALVGAAVCGAALVTTVTLTHFWTVSGHGVSQLHAALFFLLSGMLVPLPLYPDWAQGFLALQPYRAFSDAPFRLYLGDLPPGALPGVLAHQLVWTAAFVAAGRGLLARAHRHLVVQGG